MNNSGQVEGKLKIFLLACLFIAFWHRVSLGSPAWPVPGLKLHYAEWAESILATKQFPTCVPFLLPFPPHTVSLPFYLEVDPLWVTWWGVTVNFMMGFTDVLGHFYEQLQKSLLVHVCFGSFLFGKKRSLVLLGCGLGDLCLRWGKDRIGIGRNSRWVYTARGQCDLCKVVNSRYPWQSLIKCYFAAASVR